MAQNNQILKDSTNHIIKKSIAYRAKYRVTIKQINPLFVVPHPCNRGGDPVKSLRTKQLSGNLVTDGYDPTEAQSNAVAVEQKSDGSPHPRWKSFQDHFTNNVRRDPDMACAGEGITATSASLAHSHLNCTNRNILCGKRGCECPEPSAQSSKSAVAEKKTVHMQKQTDFGRRRQLFNGQIASSRSRMGAVMPRWLTVGSLVVEDGCRRARCSSAYQHCIEQNERGFDENQPHGDHGHLSCPLQARSTRDCAVRPREGQTH